MMQTIIISECRKRLLWDYLSSVYSYLKKKSKLFFFFYNWLRLLLIVCGDIESNTGPGSDRKVRVLYSNIRGLNANLDELAVPGSNYYVLVCAESKVSDRRHLSELCIPGFGCRQQRLRYTTPGAQGVVAYEARSH